MSKKTYRVPEEATAPKDNVQVDRILIDGGEDDVSIARGAWDGVPCLLIRWNGSAERPQGYPARVNNMMWYVVPRWMTASVLDAVKSRITSDTENKIRDQRPPP